MSLLMRTLHRPRQQARQPLSASIESTCQLQTNLPGRVSSTRARCYGRKHCMKSTSCLRRAQILPSFFCQELAYVNLDPVRGYRPCFAAYAVAARWMRLHDTLHEAYLSNASFNLLALPCAHNSHVVASDQRPTCACSMFHRAVSDVVRSQQLLICRFNIVTHQRRLPCSSRPAPRLRWSLNQTLAISAVDDHHLRSI